MSWTPSLPRSSGSMSTSASVADEGVVTVGDTEVKLRKSKKKKKRNSMIFISEEKERTSTLDCKRVRGEVKRERVGKLQGGGGKTETGKKACQGTFKAECSVISGAL